MSAVYLENGTGGRLPQYLQPPVPTVFTLEVTQRCEHHCLGCGNVFPHNDQEMDIGTLSDVIEWLRPHARALRITGGEPTLHSHFDRVIKLVDGLEVPFVLFTNGAWPAPERIVRILESCAHLRGVLFSLHGADATSYSRYTGADAFLSVQSNIQRTASAGLRVATNSLLLKTTFLRIDEIVALSISIGASTVAFGRYYGEHLPGVTLTDQELQVALSKVSALRRQDPRVTVSNCVPTCFLPDVDHGGRGCTSGFTHCTIGSDGEVRPCTHTPLVLGNIERDEIEGLWQSQALDEWRQRIPQPCRSCAELSRCKGGCRATAQRLGLRHDPLMRDPLSQSRLPTSIELAAKSRPRLICEIESTLYGYALSGMGHFVTLSHHSGPILDSLDGCSTIAQIQEQYGTAALQLIGSLLQKRLVTVTDSVRPKQDMPPSLHSTETGEQVPDTQ